ncbi:uncharacterized protein ATC70_007752 [Mucor velutinosus]|uniref:Nudix hydrolase domain-containing protein n=1 Tax=Mucor velutinosus TaxID=708070 RepID=A0AAN7D2I1_9FUNG|nr:hypothetical protein ATC70_007752 [Mucor velutinosus]
MKLFKKKSKTPPSTPGAPKEPEMVYSMTPRHGHAQDIFDENGVRQVAGCLPIDPIHKRFLLVSSSSNPGAWVIPKGGWEKDETQKQAAMRETWEEAGVKGVITRHIGVFAEKSKTGVKAHHWIYEMEIKEVTKKFPEQKKRERRWFTYDEAVLVVKANYIHDALSMSSLSPLVHPNPESLQTDKKKEKKEKKKKNKEAAMGEQVDDDESDEGKKKEKKDKKKKKKKNKSDGEEDSAEEDPLVDENGVPLTEEQKDALKKEKKKNKKKNKKKGEITELPDDELPPPPSYVNATPLGKMDITPPAKNSTPVEEVYRPLNPNPNNAHMLVPPSQLYQQRQAMPSPSQRPPPQEQHYVPHQQHQPYPQQPQQQQQHHQPYPSAVRPQQHQFPPHGQAYPPHGQPQQQYRPTNQPFPPHPAQGHRSPAPRPQQYPIAAQHQQQLPRPQHPPLHPDYQRAPSGNMNKP